MTARSLRTRRRFARQSRNFTRGRLLLETLEPRQLLTVDAAGIPQWIEQGPGPIVTGGDVGEQAGAINDIAVKPGDPNTIFVATVNGGIWKTETGTYSPSDGVDNDGDMMVDEADERPTWTPLTDQQQTLSMSKVAFDPSDPTGKTWWAGFGRVSNGFGDGVNSTGGLLKTTDNGATWTIKAPSQFGFRTIRGLLPTTQTDPGTGKQIILVAVQGDDGGIFRSIDGGDNFSLVVGNPGSSDGIDNDNDGLIDAADTDGGESTFGASDLVADPGNATRFYAALPEQGVFRTDDAGATWTPVNGTPADLKGALLPSGTDPVSRNSRTLLAVHDNAGVNVLYVGIIRNNLTITGGDNHAGAERLFAVFRSLDQGATYRQIQNIPTDMGVPNVHPNSMAGGNAYLTAHPTDPNVVFVGGAATPRLRVVVDDNDPSNDNWDDDYFSSNGTSPHADPRRFVFASATQAYESSDGGIYRLFNPDDSGNRRWEPMHGNLRPTEFFSVAYDPLNSTVFGGAQDNGSSAQRKTSDPTYPFFWDEKNGCDGGSTAIDYTTVANSTIHYTSSQNFDACGGLVRRTYDNTNNTAGGGDSADLIVDDTMGTVLTAKDMDGNYTLDPTIPFQIPFALNAVDQKRLIIGTSYLYESFDQGDHLTSLGGVADTGGGVFMAQNPVGSVNPTGAPLVSPIAYGGFAGGVANADVLWVGAIQGQDGLDNDMDMKVDENDEKTPTLLLRTSGTGLPTVVPNYNTAPVNGAGVRDIVMDPADWHIAYLVDNNGQVFKAVTNDDGSVVNFTNLTGNLGQLTTNFRSIEFIRTPNGDEVLLLAGAGGVYRSVNPNNPSSTPIWTDFGLNLPNALANELHYTPPLAAPLNGDTLLVGTYGRGAWTIGNASLIVDQNPVLNVCGDEQQVNQDDTIVLIRDAGNPALLNVLVNGVLEFSGPIAAFTQINVFGIGGNDNLIVDSTNGLINVPLGIRYDGDGACPSSNGEGFDPNAAGYDRGFDRLTLVQTGGPTHSSSSYLVGPQIGSGTYTISGPGAGAPQQIFFEELEPIVDTVPTLTHTITATPENNAITLLNGPNSGVTNIFNPGGAQTGFVTVDNYESSEFGNKQNVVINAGSGDDTLTVNFSTQPTGMTNLFTHGNEGNDIQRFISVPAALLGVSATADAGDDVIDASSVSANVPFDISGGAGKDTLTGGRGNDTISGDDGDDTLAGGDPAITPNIGNNTYNGGLGFDTLLILGTNANDTISAKQTNATTIVALVNGNTSNEIFDSIEQAHILAQQGNDLIRVSTADNLSATSLQRYWVQGDEPNASDRLIVTDEGLGDLVILRQADDGHSGRVSVAPGVANPPPEVVYDGIERLDIPADPITGGTGTDGKGLIKVFHADPFETNDNRKIAGQLARVPESPTSPTIDPGGLVNPFGDGTDVAGDEDWYEFRPQATGTFQVKVLFDQIAMLSNMRPGLPGDGNLNLDIYDANGSLIVSGLPASGGKAAVFAATNDPAFPQFNRIFVRVRGATADSINVYDFDNLSDLGTGNPGVGNVDVFGPQVTDVTVNNLTSAQYNLFGLKPGNTAQKPTPLVSSIVVHLKDLPPRVAGFLYPALDYNLTTDEARGLFEVRGDANGLVSIANIQIVNPFPMAIGVTPEATVRLTFAQPLPDDRFTLTVHDSLRDPAGNLLDGESNADEPNGGPFFPSGDGFAGGDFIARFTVDSRPELGAASAGSIYVDTNGNFHFDPTNGDFTNRDIAYVLGFTSDNIFAGNFSNGLPADGFDKLGAYGKVGSSFRWLLDTDNNGVADVSVVQPLVAGVTSVNGMPAAGNFDNNAANGDEVVLKVGNVWLLDTNHDFKVDTKLPGTNMIGLPIVGDFDGDGKDDLGAWADDKFSLNLSTLGPIDGTADKIFNFGFSGVRERPIAANFDGDKFDDIGLWVPDRTGVAPSESAEWYILVSGGVSIVDRLGPGNFTSFKPAPFGNDIYAQYGDEFGLPVVGNFDPPLTTATDTAPNTNPQDALDVNNDGAISPLDALLIINLLNAGQTAPPAPSISGNPFVDINNDGSISPLDALLIINWLNNDANVTPDDGGEGEAPAASDAAAASDDYFATLAMLITDPTNPATARSRR